MYQLYTLPTCEHCHAAVNLMNTNGISFEQIDASSPEGIKRFREFYSKNRDKLARDNSGCAVLPIVIEMKDENLTVYQGTNGLEKFLGI